MKAWESLKGLEGVEEENFTNSGTSLIRPGAIMTPQANVHFRELSL